MEELIDAFAVSQVTVQPNSTAAQHPHFSLYKVKQSASSQEERRRKFLEAQKKKRFDYANHARRLADCDWNTEECKDEEATDQNESQDMDYEEIIKKTPRTYKNQLMLSEWLVEVPIDLESQWFLMLCPVGKRCLVVSSRGKTKVYTRSGYNLCTFKSQLPGSNAEEKGNRYSLLDCIYNDKESTFHILDVMCWNSHPCYDSETEFRFYWMHSKVQETPEIKVISENNPYKFIPLPYYSCDKESIKNVLWSPLPFPSELDGLLFYHKRTHYTCGSTPLVGWLKAYMVPEMLGVEVPEALLKDKPASYVSMKQHIPKAFAKSEERKKAEEKLMQYEDD